MAFHLLVIDSKGISGSSLALSTRGISLSLCAGLVFVLDNSASVLAVGRFGVLRKHTLLRLHGVLFIGLLDHLELQTPTIFAACLLKIMSIRFELESLST